MSFGDETPDIDQLASWPRFAAAVRARLEQGRTTYGERSFSRDPAELLVELQQEALDLAGWGHILFTRLEQMQRELAAARGQASEHGGEGSPLASEPSSVHLPGFTPETLALLAELAERLQRPPGEVIAMALRVLVATFDRGTRSSPVPRLPGAARGRLGPKPEGSP